MTIWIQIPGAPNESQPLLLSSPQVIKPLDCFNLGGLVEQKDLGLKLSSTAY